jgi:hypothetical protein
MYRTVCITYFLNDNKFGEKNILYLLECAVPVKMPPIITKTNMLPSLPHTQLRRSKMSSKKRVKVRNTTYGTCTLYRWRDEEGL